MGTNPYTRWIDKINPHILCGAGHPDLHLAGQIRSRTTSLHCHP